MAELLSRGAREEEDRLAELTSTSLPALRAYLEGQAAYRRGDYPEVLRRHAAALDLDSTFALAGLGLVLAGGWVGGSSLLQGRGFETAWRHRDRLSERDRLVLAAFSPEYPGASSARQRLEAREQALRRAPDRPELWYLLGDVLFHFHAVLGLEAGPERARAAFQRATELDSAFAEPVHHLASVLGHLGDTLALRALAARRLARDPEGPVAEYLRWRTRAAFGERSAFGSAALDSLAIDATLRWIGIEAQDYGFAVADGERAVRLRDGPGTRDQRAERRMGMLSYALNGGRPAEAAAILGSLPEVQSDPRFHLRLAVLTALYADGDAATAERAAHELARAEAGALNRCVLAQWRLQREGPGHPGVHPGPRGGAAPVSIRERICEAVVEALAGPGLAEPAALGRLEALVGSGAFSGLVDDGQTEYASIALARLHVAAGDSAAALAALRRRTYYNGWQPYLAAALREEGRLAAALGDTAGAVRAYEHFLAFRSRPEPHLRGQVERVRGELARLR